MGADPPGDLFDSVGRDVVRRAADRVGVQRSAVASSDDLAAGFDGGRRCVVCLGERWGGGAWPSAVVGGRVVAVCAMCARMAVTATDYLPDLRACLVGLATHVEHVASDIDAGGGSRWHDPETGEVPAVRRVVPAIAERFRRGVFASACDCPAHAAARAGRLARASPLAAFPAGEAPEVSDLPLLLVRSFPEAARVTFHGVPMLAGEVVDAIKARNAAATAYPGLNPGGLAARARALASPDAVQRWRAFHRSERSQASAAGLVA